MSRRSTSRYLTDSWLLIGRAERCTVQLLCKTCCLVTGCGITRQSNGYLLMAVLMLLCSIRIRWVQCALIFLTDSFPTEDFDFTWLFDFCTSFFSLCSRHASQQCLPIYLSNSCHMMACAAYIIANISKPTRMSKPAHLENYFEKP